MYFDQQCYSLFQSAHSVQVCHVSPLEISLSIYKPSETPYKDVHYKLRAYKQQFKVFIFLNFTIFWRWHFWGWNDWSKHSKEKKSCYEGNILNSLVALSLFKTSSLDSEKKKKKILLCFSEQALSAVSVTDISTLTVSQRKIKPMQKNWGIPALARAFFIFFLVCSLEA